MQAAKRRACRFGRDDNRPCNGARHLVCAIPLIWHRLAPSMAGLHGAEPGPWSGSSESEVKTAECSPVSSGALHMIPGGWKQVGCRTQQPRAACCCRAWVATQARHQQAAAARLLVRVCCSNPLASQSVHQLTLHSCILKKYLLCIYIATR